MATSLINTANLHNNTYANASKTKNNAGINTKFTAADFQRWNQTTSVVHIPSRLVKNSKIPQLRKELIHAVGERKVSAVQALSPIKYHVQYKHSSDRHAAEINGITFRGVHLTPLPAYEEVKSVFVERAPLHMQDNYLYEALAPYGRVIGVQHLTIKGFPTVRSGTRRVSMVVTKAIPRTINIGGFPVVFNYRGQPTQCFVCQEVGHASKDCPNSRQGRKLQQQQQQQNLPKTTGKDKAQNNNNKSKHKANNTKPALGHDDLKIKLDGAKRTVQTTQNKKKSPLGETDLRNKLNKKQGVVLKSSETEPSPASTSLPTKSKAGRAKGQSLSKGRSSATDDVIVDEVARSPKAVAELMDTQPSQETSTLTTSPPAQHLATLRRMFNVPATSDDDLEPGEIKDSSSIQSMDDERSSDHADPKTKLDGATKSIQLMSEADSPLRVQSHSTSPPLTQQLKQLRSEFNMPATSASESEEITEADFAASIITAEHQAAAAKSGQVRTAVRTVTTLRVRRRRSGLSQAPTPAQTTTTFTTASRSSSTITTSTWTKPTGGRTKVTATQAEIDRDDIPLAVLRKNKRRRLSSTTPPKDEELDCCLSGSSVIDPLAIEYWQTTPISSFGQTPSLPALEAPSATPNVALQQQQQQPAEDMSLVPLDGTQAIPATAPEPEVTLDPMATPFGALMQEEEEILIQVRDEGEVSWASEVASDPRGTPPLVGVEIGILEPGQIGPDPSSFYDPLVVPISPPGGEVTPISSPVQINTPVFYRPSVDGDESPPGSVASSTDFLPSPASSQGLFDRLVCGAPDDAIESAREPTTIDEINRAILTELSSPELPLSPEFLPLTLESNDEFDFSQHQRS